MAKTLDGRMVIVTGAGHGLGRAHALYMADRGAKVVVNDMGGSVHGEGNDPGPASAVVREITARGGEAVASAHDVADWKQARELIELALEHFGGLHVVVNNAGIVRDRTLVNMSEVEWDAVVRVHLKGHAAPAKFALKYWREQSKRGEQVRASIIHTTSVSGLAGIYGQSNYASAKLGIVGLSRVISLEGQAYGVRSNVISPSARTRITDTVSGMTQDLSPAASPGPGASEPDKVSPIVAWLAEAECRADSQIFHIGGSRLLVLKLAEIVHEAEIRDAWTPEMLQAELVDHLASPTTMEAILGRPIIVRA